MARLSDDGQRLENLRVIFRQHPPIDVDVHYGARVVEAPGGTVWIATGERGLFEAAQNTANTVGKVVRVTRAG